MKFVYFGYDFMLGTVQRLLEDGHELAGIFTFPCDNVFNFNTQTQKLAAEKKVPISFEKPRADEIDYLIKNEDVDVFIAAGYLFKIPDVTPAYGLNVHPSLLPKGRSLMPIPHILLNHPEAAGFTIHKLAEQLDSGDIIYQEPLAITSTETVETLATRMALHAPAAMSKILENLPLAWGNAKKQNENEALYFPPPDDRMRLLDWTLPLERLDKIARAFGHFGCLAHIGDNLWVVYAHDIRMEAHKIKLGTVTAENDNGMTVATNGGYFILKKFEKLAQSQ